MSDQISSSSQEPTSPLSLAIRRFPDLNTLLQGTPTGLRDENGRGFFLPNRPVHIARAPGRLDVMGGIADYSGSLVLQLPMARATFAAVQRDDSNLISIASLPEQAGLPTRLFRATVQQLWQWVSEDACVAGSFFRQDPRNAWAAYGIGVLLALAKECGWRWKGGMRILVASAVPEGKGVSSSAAMEVAVLQAACQ